MAPHGQFPVPELQFKTLSQLEESNTIGYLHHFRRYVLDSFVQSLCFGPFILRTFLLQRGLRFSDL